MDELLHIPLSAPSAPYTARKNYFNTFPEVKHDHLYWEMVIVLSGRVTQFVGNESKEMKAGDVLLLRPHDIHSFKIYDVEKYEHRDVYIPCHDMTELCRGLDETLYNTIYESDSLLFCSLPDPLLGVIDSQLANYENLDLKKDNPYRLLTFRSIISYLVGLLVQENLTKDTRPDWLIKFLAKLAKPENISLPLLEIVKLSGFSHSRLCVLFKRYMDKTLNEYIVEQRLELSLWLLNTSEASVLEISTRLGYDSMSHFIHIFKKRYGVTPDKCRRLYRKQQKP